MGIKSAFNSGAKDYDGARKQLIPCFDDFYGNAMDVISQIKREDLKVLDLGAGTGLFSYLVAKRFPNAKITLVDLSEKMLDEAEKRFKGLDANVEYRVINYATEPLGEGFDLIISALSIHHLTDSEKEYLFGKIYSSLKPGGLFVNADQALGESKEIEALYRANWIRDVKAKGASNDSLNAALERMKEDKMTPLSKQLRWLNESNFLDVNCWYKNQSFVVYAGWKN